MSLNITFTSAACDYIKKMVDKENGIGLRLSIKKTGCTGFAYAPAILKKENEKDQAIVVSNGTKVFIDTEWLELFDGVTVDYIEEEKTGLKQKKLIFINPKEAGRCGCGESFHV